MWSVRWWSVRSCTLGVAAAVLAACSHGTPLQMTGPCPSYRGGNASPTSLAGSYAVVSYCQGSLPASDLGGSLTITASPDSLHAWVERGRLSPVVLVGPYAIAGDTITVGSFVGTYAFSANRLYLSGSLPGSSLPIAMVFAR
jgi:hypothetical protein